VKAATITVPVLRPQLPRADALLPYLERIDEARWYSNHGTLLRELEARLANHYGISPTNVSVVANGTVALSAALLAVGAKPGTKCLLPSWTFVASASAAWAANLIPHFVDVDPHTWMLDPNSIKARKDLADVSAVMVVSAFGAPVDVAAWDRFTEETGIPAIIDGAASFDSVASVAAARPGKTPIMISLHATKVFGTGEGGLLLSTDDDAVRRFNQICNFGVWDSPAGQILGYNGKLSEYNAAVGLAFLDMWPKRRDLVADLTTKYAGRLSEYTQLETVPGYGEGWIACYCIVATTTDAAAVIDRLREEGVETRRWWQSGVHVQKAYQQFPRDPLPVTEDLARRVFGLPFFHDLSADQFEHVLAALSRSL
jgi:dTDP-4-amino-4,6-dideoxygalactose transaminase